MIECIGVSKTYKRNLIVNTVDLVFPSNEISFIMGDNGAGKTTLIKCMLDLEEYSGKILFDSVQVEKVKNQCIAIYDDCPFYTNLSGIKNLSILCEGEVGKEEIQKVASNYLDYSILKSKVSKYSYGQKKKLGIILVKLLKPRFIILDEITNGLDYSTLEQLKKEMASWGERATIVMTGHQFDFYNNFVDNLFIMKDGNIARDNTFSKETSRLEEIYHEKMLAK